jgi:hypothetical protein
VVASSTIEAFRQACRDGDSAGAERELLRVDDEAVSRLVKGIGGPRAMVRFLVQRRHVLHMWETPSLATWLTEHLREAEPMHLLDVRTLLPLAERAGHEAIVYRLKAHLKFVQPPDPTRWSRKLNTPAEAAYLLACETGDPEAVAAALADDPALVTAVNKWGQDGAALLGAYGSERGHEVLQVLCTAGVHKTAVPLVTAAWWASVPIVEGLIAAEFPLARPIDENALWSAAAATRLHEKVTLDDFEAVATLLVNGGGDPNAVNRWGSTAWGVASAEARPVLVKLGAEPREKGDAHYQRDTGCSEIIDRLAAGDEVEGEDLDINEAAAVGDVTRVRHLLDELYRHKPMLCGHGCPERPLHLAAYFGHVDVAWMLITEYGYSPGSVSAALIDGSHVGPKETWDKTALEVAVSRGHTRLVEVLMNSVDWFQGRRARRK